MNETFGSYASDITSVCSSFGVNIFVKFNICIRSLYIPATCNSRYKCVCSTKITEKLICVKKRVLVGLETFTGAQSFTQAQKRLAVFHIEIPLEFKSLRQIYRFFVYFVILFRTLCSSSKPRAGRASGQPI